MENFKILGICTDTRKKNGIPLLRNGEKVYGATGWYRIVNPLKKLGANIEVGIIVRTTAEDAMRLKALGDIWFMKMADNENIDFLYATHRDFAGTKLIVDLDDDIDNVHPDHPEFEGLKEKLPMRERMVKIADHIVVATEHIAKGIRHLNPNITVIPNAIDPKIWEVKKKKRKDGKIRIGWMASGSHFVDSPIIEDIMQELLKEYPNLEFHVAGMVKGYVKGERWVHHEGTVGYDEFPQFYADLGIDIGIAPLKDIPFNHSKSNIKFLEGAMLEIPMVLSDISTYDCVKHGTTGYLASNAAEFKKYLKFLIENPDKREEIGKAAKKYVLENHTIDKFLPKYTELFEKLLDKKDITVMTAITGGKDNLYNQPEYKGVEYMAFLEEDVKSPQWKVKRACDKFVKPVMNAKIHKILGHKYCNTPYIVWQDGNCALKQDPHELVKLMGDNDFAFFKHPGRDCLFDEADTCVQLGKGNITEIAEQVRAYADPHGVNMDLHSGMIEATCFARKNNPHANDLMEKWWAEICRYSNRDQISFPVVFKGQTWATIPGSVEKHPKYGKPGGKPWWQKFPGNDFFKYTKHNHYE